MKQLDIRKVVQTYISNYRFSIINYTLLECFQPCWCCGFTQYILLGVSIETLWDEILSVLWNSLEQLGGEVEAGGGDIPQGLLVAVPAEGRETGEKNIRHYAQGPNIRR